MPETTARVALSPTAEAPARGLQAAQAADARDEHREHERLHEAGHEVGRRHRAVDFLEERDERDRERLHRQRAAEPSRPASQNRVSSGVISRAAMIRGVTRKRTGSRPIVVSASTSWLTRHRADLGGERRAGAAGEQDRRHQRTELAHHRETDQVRDEDLGAETLHRHGRLEREDQPEQERDQRHDRQRVGADPLADAPDVAPAHAGGIDDDIREGGDHLADERYL